MVFVWRQTTDFSSGHSNSDSLILIERLLEKSSLVWSSPGGQLCGVCSSCRPSVRAWWVQWTGGWSQEALQWTSRSLWNNSSRPTGPHPGHPPITVRSVLTNVCLPRAQLYARSFPYGVYFLLLTPHLSDSKLGLREGKEFMNVCLLSLLVIVTMQGPVRLGKSAELM